MPQEIVIQLPKLFASQQAIKDTPFRFGVLNCGRRYGKTSFAIDLMVTSILHGQLVGYFTPRYKDAELVWEEMKRILYPLIVKRSEIGKRLIFANGATLEVWSSTDENSGRSRKFHLIVFDEAAKAKNLEKIWEGALRPTLSDYRGRALFLSTPQGRNFFWRLYQRGLSDQYPEWRCWTHPTYDNPYILDTEIESARRDMTDRMFRQEYLAEFIEDSGTVFRGVYDVLMPEDFRPPYQERYSYVMGIDWGRHLDYTVLSVWEVESKRLVDLDRFSRVGYSLQRDRIMSLYHKWRCRTIWAESNSAGEPNIEALQQDGLPVRGFHTTAQSKNRIIESLALHIEQERIELLYNEDLINEFVVYEMKKTTNGWKYGAPDGYHDDIVMSIAIGFHGVLQHAGDTGILI